MTKHRGTTRSSADWSRGLEYPAIPSTGATWVLEAAAPRARLDALDVRDRPRVLRRLRLEAAVWGLVLLVFALASILLWRAVLTGTEAPVPLPPLGICAVVVALLAALNLRRWLVCFYRLYRARLACE